ncbi:Homoserine kinase [Methylobacterium crusticola]|uniref:Homoserine kinase n=1 Tax=Methylobacterium crusticola TaxID=1697972 RepID=A0ABQ4QXT5_9HYPH|nr:homoserine kinase [Methylobacterium crusticola]GJD50073.1 Homoserine kinase [Methylobacterium crusticola]
MAVYTEVPDEALGAFLAEYDIGTLLSYKGIAEGVENTNFILHATTGAYILTLYEKRVAEGDLPFFLGLMEHLASRGLACPQPIRTRAGAALGRLCGRPAVVVSFLEGVSVRRPGTAHCRALGSALAGLHAAGADFAMRRPNALSVAAWGPLFAQAEAQADRVAPNLAARTRQDLAALEGAWPTDLPGGVIHADLFTDNVFFLGEAVSGLIDFYFACTDAFAYDLAICLNAWCFEADGAYNRTKGQAMIAAYQAERRLEPREVAALPLLCRGAALRFMLTRLVDWLNVPPGALVRPKDPLEYDRKLAFHRRVTDAAEYGWSAPGAA